MLIAGVRDFCFIMCRCLNNYIFSAANNVKSKEMLLSLRLILKNVMINLKQIKQ